MSYPNQQPQAVIINLGGGNGAGYPPQNNGYPQQGGFPQQQPMGGYPQHHQPMGGFPQHHQPMGGFPQQQQMGGYPQQQQMGGYPQQQQMGGYPQQQPMGGFPQQQQQQAMEQHTPRPANNESPPPAPIGNQSTAGYAVVEGIPYNMEKDLENISAVQISDDRTEVDGCTIKNFYKIQDQNGHVTYFMGSDESTCCTRCTPSCMRGVNFQIMNNNNQVLVSAEKDCGCPCFAPELKLTAGTSGKTLGYIRDTVDCGCTENFSIAGPDGKDAIVIAGSKCQCGLCCPMPCGPCKEVNFLLYDKHRGTSAQAKLGSIDRTSDCCGCCCGKEQTYQILFGSVERGDWRFLVMTAAMFMQNRMFYKPDRNS